MNLYKCNCSRTSGKILKGMNIEVITSSGEPQSDQIRDAIERKYGISTSSLSINSMYWNFELLS